MLNRLQYILLFVFSVILTIAQQGRESSKAAYSLKSILLEKDPNRIAWLYYSVDVPENSLVNLDEEKWIILLPTFSEKDTKLNFVSPCWFRIHLKIDTLQGKVLGMILDHRGASEVYIDGKLAQQFGVVSGDEKIERAFNPTESPVEIQLPDSGYVSVAIRYSNTHASYTYANDGYRQPGFSARFQRYAEALSDNFSKKLPNLIVATGLGMFFFTLGLVHLILFIYYRSRKVNLHYAGFCLIISLLVFNGLIIGDSEDIATANKLRYFGFFLSNVFFFLLPYLVASIFEYGNHRVFRYFGLLVLFNLVLSFFLPDYSVTMFGIIIPITIILTFYFLIKAFRSGKKDVKIIFFGFGFFILMFSVFTISAFFKRSIVISDYSFLSALILLSVFLAVISIPVSMTFLLAKEFARTSKTLEIKLIEVETLSAKTIEQEKEKQRILSNQNEILEQQVKERTKEIELQKKIIEEKNKDITDSINYAQRIQQSVLPTEKEIKEIFPDSLVLFKPRDIVSGDFYQFKQKDDYKFAILADCTGHGVPGALMSMIGSNLLKQIIMERGIFIPDKILTELHREVKATLRQGSAFQSHDGMDITICMHKGKDFYISSANRPVYMFIDNEFKEIKPDKKSIGGASTSDIQEFTLHHLTVQSPLTVYMFSDGYADQFGGPEGKKFKLKRLQQLITEICTKPFSEQTHILNSTFTDWRGLVEQVDDVSIIAIRA